MAGEQRRSVVTDPIGEGAKAAKEVAKTTGKAIDAAREVGHWFDGKTGQALEEAIGWAVTDNIRRSRELREIRHQERLAILMHETQQRLAALGSPEVKPPPDTTTVPLIEAASLEDDPELQKLWAGLLATALTAEEEDYRHFVAILRELRSFDAAALTAYYQGHPDVTRQPWSTERHISYASDTLDGDQYGIEVTRNLARLGLVEPAPVIMEVSQAQRTSYGEPPDIQPLKIVVPGDLYRVVMTHTGKEFCAAIGIEPTATLPK